MYKIVMNWNLAYALLAAGAGACIAMQASANGAFRKNLDNQWYATFFSICGTFATAIVAMIAFRPSPPSAEAFRSTQWWNWIGGPLGAFIVLAGCGSRRDWERPRSSPWSSAGNSCAPCCSIITP